MNKRQQILEELLKRCRQIDGDSPFAVDDLRRIVIELLEQELIKESMINDLSNLNAPSQAQPGKSRAQAHEQ